MISMYNLSILLSIIFGICDLIESKNDYSSHSHRNHSLKISNLNQNRVNLLSSIANRNNNGSINVNEQNRNKRQQYLCGIYPNQFYSLYPCNYNAKRCTNGGAYIGVGCYRAIDCTPYYNGVSTCINRCCCTVPQITYTPTPSLVYGICPNGQQTLSTCQSAGQCSANQICINGLCCTKTTNDYLYVCGGQAALGNCVGNQCGSSYYCTPANYCCECPIGQTAGQCGVFGACPSGYQCAASGFCCVNSCPNGRPPTGACQPQTGFCPTGLACAPGNICCQ